MKKRVLLAFSGGMDSCHAVGVLRSGGYQVHGLTLDTHGEDSVLQTALERARELEMPLKIIDVRDEFRTQVMDYFLKEYLCGRTPAPCTLCNPRIKWATLYREAAGNGFDNIATGHYFNITTLSGRHYVSRGADPAKDQSYYLWMLPQHILDIALTPLGEAVKSGIRENLPPSRRKESMGVCFLKGCKCSSFLKEAYSDPATLRRLEAQCAFAQRDTEARLPSEGTGHTTCCAHSGKPSLSFPQSGDIVDSSGRIVGHHDGIPFYTIGQKKGAGIPPGLCVTGIDHDANRLIAGLPEGLWHTRLYVRMENIVDREEFTRSPDITAVVRGYGWNPGGYCRVSGEDGQMFRIELDEPAWACAPGQPVVFYRGDRVIAGGFLENSKP